MANETKKALIVGASRGLGLGLVQELASRGWQVTATARDLTKATGLRDLPGNVQLETIDIDDAASVNALAQRLSGQSFDVVFINAGITGPRDNVADSATPADIAQLFGTNSVSPIRLARKLVGTVKTGTGILAFMSSGMGSVSDNTTGGMELYRASKAALNSLIHSFKAGLGDKSITILSVNPGWVRTDMGGADAPLDVATSSRGTADMLEKRAGTGGIAFVDYQNEELPW
jgi:NAD(P)-dependent dehydrogenase (short-subunit alcohol dehydrogenase family)